MITEKLINAAKDQFFQRSTDLLCIVGFDGYLKHHNPAWEKILGFSPAELQSCPFIEFVHPDDRSTTLQGADSFSFENRFCCKDGSYRWFAWTATAVPRQHLFYATARDITDRKQAEAALTRSQQKLALLIEQSSIGVIEWSTQFEVVAWNPAAEVIFGYSADETIGRTAFGNS
jgi:two-component system, NtrC family, sensor kinase